MALFRLEIALGEIRMLLVLSLIFICWVQLDSLLEFELRVLIISTLSANKFIFFRQATNKCPQFVLKGNVKVRERSVASRINAVSRFRR